MRISWVVFLVACGTSAETPQETSSPTPVVTARPVLPSEPACETTLADTAKRIATASKKVGLDTTSERIRLTMTASCEAEAWPASILKCIEAARLDVDLASCTEQLPHEQYQRLQKKIAQLVPTPTPTPPPTVAAATRRPPRAIDDVLDPFRRAEPAKLDCAKTVVDARNRACLRQYCALHSTEPRCDIE